MFLLGDKNIEQHISMFELGLATYSFEEWAGATFRIDWQPTKTRPEIEDPSFQTF